MKLMNMGAIERRPRRLGVVGEGGMVAGIGADLGGAVKGRDVDCFMGVL